MPILNFLKNKIYFDGTPTLKQLLLQNGLSDFLPCAKSGVCGGCANNACKRVLSDDTVIDAEGMVFQDSIAKSACDGIAIDIGTTTVVCALIHNGKRRTCAALNPQTSVAPDVVGRIGFSVNGGRDKLQKLITDCIRGLLQKVCEDFKVNKYVITGNTAMLYFLTDTDANDLARSPFLAKKLFGDRINNVYFPRCISAFVGADTTCAILASGMCDKNETALLVDIGTNGEIALFKDGRLYVTSTAAGPVFEGAGIACGMLACDGAIDSVYYANGRIYATTIGHKKAVGICGSGVIDAVATLVELDEIDAEKTVIEGDVYITSEDVQKLMYAKAAIRAGIEVLCETAGVELDNIDTLYVAGGFGSHINLENAAKIGLVPKHLVPRAKVLGNAALCGAEMCLCNTDKADEIAKSAISINLGGNESFNKKYIENMYF